MEMVLHFGVVKGGERSGVTQTQVGLLWTSGQYFKQITTKGKTEAAVSEIVL